MEIFGEIFEDFWILFGALIRAVSVDRAVRAIRVVWVIWVFRAVRTYKVVRVVGAVKAIRARAFYKVSGEQDFSHS